MTNARSDQWRSSRAHDGDATPFGAALDRLKAAREEVAPDPDAAFNPSFVDQGPPADEASLADDLRARLADRRETTAAARFSAATYAAAHGHVPGGADDELGPAQSGGWRWTVRPRTALVAAAAVLLLGVGFVAVSTSAEENVEPLAVVAPADGAEAEQQVAPSPTPSAAPEVVVDVVGQVHAPGLVTLPAGSRVADAVAAVGGATEGAELSAVNLARPLVDGEQIRIPAPGETVTPPPPQEAPGTGGGTPGTSTAPDGGLVNLNTADAATLETLPGVGPALAGRIIEWREANGAFASIDELDEVSGIGPALLAKVRDLVTV